MSMRSKTFNPRQILFKQRNLEQYDPWTYRGRNGSGTLHGISIMDMGEYLYVSIINKTGVSDAVTIDIPHANLDELISVLQQIRKENSDTIIKLKK